MSVMTSLTCFETDCSCSSPYCTCVFDCSRYHRFSPNSLNIFLHIFKTKSTFFFYDLFKIYIWIYCPKHSHQQKWAQWITIKLSNMKLVKCHQKSVGKKYWTMWSSVYVFYPHISCKILFCISQFNDFESSNSQSSQ